MSPLLFDPSEEFEASLRSLLVERIHIVSYQYEKQSKDWWEIERLLPVIEQQLPKETQGKFGELTDLFRVYAYDFALECYKAGLRDVHSLFTDRGLFRSPPFYSK